MKSRGNKKRKEKGKERKNKTVGNEQPKKGQVKLWEAEEDEELPHTNEKQVVNWQATSHGPGNTGND